MVSLVYNELRPERNDENFADNIFQYIYLNENYCILFEPAMTKF